jgi:uncharacterized membrane protein
VCSGNYGRLTVSTVLIIIGLIFVVVGLVIFLLPAPKPEATAQGVVGDLAKVLEQINTMFDKFDKRFRPGMFLMIVGLVLIGLGAFTEAKDAKDAAESTAMLLVGPGLLRLRRI